MAKNPLQVLQEIYCADTAALAKELECKESEAFQAQQEAAAAAQPYLQGDELTACENVIRRVLPVKA